MKKHSKAYILANKEIDPKKFYKLEEAFNLIKKINFSKNKSSIKISLKLNLDIKKHSIHSLKTYVDVPHNLGVNKLIIVFAEENLSRLAIKNGADFVGDEKLIDKIKNGWDKFDVVLSTSKFMNKISTLGKFLGPRNLMPTYQMGNIVSSENIVNTIKKIKVGRLNLCIDKHANLNFHIGHSNLNINQLMNNYDCVMHKILKVKPKNSKINYIRSIYCSNNFGPSIKLENFKK